MALKLKEPLRCKHGDERDTKQMREMTIAIKIETKHRKKNSNHPIGWWCCCSCYCCCVCTNADRIDDSSVTRIEVLMTRTGKERARERRATCE